MRSTFEYVDKNKCEEIKQITELQIIKVWEFYVPYEHLEESVGGGTDVAVLTIVTAKHPSGERDDVVLCFALPVRWLLHQPAEVRLPLQEI